MENEWKEISKVKPPVGVIVEVETIYGFEDTGIWDGTQWINSNLEFKGLPEEAPKWRTNKFNE